MMKNTEDIYALALKVAKTEPDNYEKISKLLEKSHLDGDGRASYALATWYLFGHGKYKKNYKKAVHLLKIAANKNIPSAHFDLAICYEKGNGVNKNERKAYLNYLSGALNGDVDSIAEVGRCLYYGIGIDRDRRSSKIWLDKAASLK